MEKKARPIKVIMVNPLGLLLHAKAVAKLHHKPVESI